MGARQMLSPWSYPPTGRAFGYIQARRRFMQNLLAWDELGEAVNRLARERRKAGTVVSWQYARYVRDKTDLAWPERGQGNRAMRRMSAMCGVECWDERREPPLHLV